MKKIFALIMALLMMISLTACGNYDMFDTVYTYDYAIVSFPDGTTETIEIDQWSDYDGEQIQIIAKDGTVYLINSVNCVLVKKGDKKD